jgi:hypothetical protein
MTITLYWLMFGNVPNNTNVRTLWGDSREENFLVVYLSGTSLRHWIDHGSLVEKIIYGRYSQKPATNDSGDSYMRIQLECL